MMKFEIDVWRSVRQKTKNYNKSKISLERTLYTHFPPQTNKLLAGKQSISLIKFFQKSFFFEIFLKNVGGPGRSFWADDWNLIWELFGQFLPGRSASFCGNYCFNESRESLLWNYNEICCLLIFQALQLQLNWPFGARFFKLYTFMIFMKNMFLSSFQFIDFHRLHKIFFNLQIFYLYLVEWEFCTKRAIIEKPPFNWCEENILLAIQKISFSIFTNTSVFVIIFCAKYRIEKVIDFQLI